MPKIRKAARGKHRWLGIVLGNSYSDIESVRSDLMGLLDYKYIKLYDFVIEGNNRSCIVKIKLEKYLGVREKLEKNDLGIFSITSSGKIRLVRSRIEEYFQRQIDV